MKDPVSSSSPHQGSGQAALAWSVRAGKADDVLRHMEASIARRRRSRIIAVGGALVLVLGLGLFWKTEHRAVSVPAAVPSTAVVSRPPRQALPDGSIVELNQGARISVEFTPALRRVALISGEAHFQVSRNPARPFIVTAGGVDVRAVGTAFVVQIGERAIDVVVTEGSVAVESTSPGSANSGSPPVPIAILDAGTRISVEHSFASSPTRPAIVAIDDQDMNERLAWRVPRLEFNGTPLSQVIPMFNEHGRANLTFDPSLGQLQLSGALRADSIDALLTLLKNEFGIEADQRSDAQIYLRRR